MIRGMAEIFAKNVKKQVLLRAAVRGAVCAAAAVCALQAAGPAWLSAVLPSLSPFTALLAVAAGAGGVLLLGAAAVGAACVFFPRFFCRWVCPVGSCRDALTGWVPRRKWVGRVPPVGVWLVFIGAGAALAGYPLFGWLDPLVIFNAAFGMARKHLVLWDWLAAAGLPLLLILDVAAPGLWCGKLCPLGATQDVLRLLARTGAWGKAGAPEEQGVPGCKPPVLGAASRRVFLGLGLGAGYRLAVNPARGEPAGVIRPPASGLSARFTRLCVRCGNCVRACPNGIIRFGGTGTGWAGVLAPEVSFERDYCPASCTACGQVCPTGAIPRFKKETKSTVPMGRAEVDMQSCLLGEGRECGACAGACPHEALELVWDKVEMVSRVVVNAKACTGCGYCEYVCPSEPKAICVKALKRVGNRTGGGNA